RTAPASSTRCCTRCCACAWTRRGADRTRQLPVGARSAVCTLPRHSANKRAVIATPRLLIRALLTTTCALLRQTPARFSRDRALSSNASSEEDLISRCFSASALTRPGEAKGQDAMAATITHPTFGRCEVVPNLHAIRWKTAADQKDVDQVLSSHSLQP